MCTLRARIAYWSLKSIISVLIYSVSEINRKARSKQQNIYLIYHIERISIKNYYLSISVRVTFWDTLYIWYCFKVSYIIILNALRRVNKCANLYRGTSLFLLTVDELSTERILIIILLLNLFKHDTISQTTYIRKGGK